MTAEDKAGWESGATPRWLSPLVTAVIVVFLGLLALAAG
jgi:hypothetical protein